MTAGLRILRACDEGRLRIHRGFASQYLSTKRNLAVYLPPGYPEQGRRYPVLYLQDGQNLFDPATAFAGQDWRADITADDLIRRGEIEPLILVGVYHTGVHRVSEYTPTRDRTRRKGGKAARYAQMLAREIKPFIDSEYRTSRKAEHTGVGGSSLGALASLVAALEYPRVFGRVAAVSPSVWWDGRSILDVVRAYRSAARPRIWLDVGTEEAGDARWVVEDARLLRDVLVEKGWRPGSTLEYREFAGAGHCEAAWGGRLGEVLSYLFREKLMSPDARHD
jgi:predicted alpha/beta superfamily hydrolase